MNVIIHFDEIALKGNNQQFFIQQLSNNLVALFPAIKVSRIEGGMWLENLSEEDLPRLGLIPGIAVLAPAIKCGSEISAIQEAIDTLLKDYPRQNTTFRLSASRSYKKFPLTSREVDKEVGGYVADKYGFKVDLKNFKLEIHVDIGKDHVVIYRDLIPGAGGLPTGTAGKVMVLLSGGIDSPVAAYQLMKRGAEVVLIHFQNETRVTEEVSQKIFDLAKTLSRYQPRVRLLIVPFAGWQKQIVMNIPADCRMILTRRLMFRIAEKAAPAEDCLALATGDSLGQVASQTLENMTAIYNATPLLKLTPLIGTNKLEIVNLARKIGTLEISNRPYEDCCSLFVAKHPQTRAQLSNILRLEKTLDLSALDKQEIISYYISMNS